MKPRADVWSDYATLFSALTSRFQQEMYEHASRHLSGAVVDCGCGAAKLLPYLVANPDVSAYLGVDSSAAMIERAEALLARFPRFDAAVRCQAIEDTAGRFDSAVSLQSYYSWGDRAGILRGIRDMIREDGTFVLASADADLDIDRLLAIVSKELLMHPGWDEYASINRSLAGSEGNFVSLDTLIREAHVAGFRVREAHTELFDGGVNLLVLTG